MPKVQAMPVAVSSRLGEYRIMGHLGHKPTPDLLVAVLPGGPQPDQLYVLKLFPSEDFDNVAAVAMLVNRARTATLLRHPNIARTYDVAVDEGVTFMVREYVDGQSLENILADPQRPGDRGLDLSMRLRIVRDTLAGLHYAHELRDSADQPLNVVHGDVTPHNILVTYDGHAKLLDFGLADAVTMSSPTRVSTVKGKVSYSAPEQVGNSAGTTRASDIFQIGLLLWEGAVGHRAWQGMDEYEILLRLNSKYGTLFVPPAGADADLVTICQRATAVNPDERYPSALQFKNDVEAYMAKRGIAVGTDAIGNYVADRFEDQRRAARQAILARMKSEEFDALGPLVGGEAFPDADTIVEPGTVAEPGKVVGPADAAESGAFVERDTIVEPGTVVQPTVISDTGAISAPDTIVEQRTVVPGAIAEARTVVDSGPARAFRASLVFHEPIPEPAPAAEPPDPGHQTMTVWPAPSPVAAAAQAEAARPEPQPTPAKPEAKAESPSPPRRLRLSSTTITVAAGVLGVVLAFALAPRARKAPSKPPTPPAAAKVSGPAAPQPVAPPAAVPPPKVEPLPAPTPAATLPVESPPPAAEATPPPAAEPEVRPAPSPAVPKAKAKAAKRAHGAGKGKPAATRYKPGLWR